MKIHTFEIKYVQNKYFPVKIMLFQTKYVQISNFDIKITIFSKKTRTKLGFVRDPPSSPKGGRACQRPF